MREQAAQLPCGGEHNVEWRPDTSSRGPQQLVVFVTRFIPRGEELLGRYYTGAAPKSGAASKARAEAPASAAGTAPVPPLPPPTLDAERPALKRARLSPTAAAPSSTPARVLPPPTLHIPAGGSAAVPAPAPPPTPVSPPPPTAAAAVTTSRSFALPGFASSLDAFAGHLREQGRAASQPASFATLSCCCQCRAGGHPGRDPGHLPRIRRAGVRMGAFMGSAQHERCRRRGTAGGRRRRIRRRSGSTLCRIGPCHAPLGGHAVPLRGANPHGHPWSGCAWRAVCVVPVARPASGGGSPVRELGNRAPSSEVVRWGSK